MALTWHTGGNPATTITNHGAGSFVLPTFTPTANSRLFVIVGGAFSGTATWAPTCTATGLTFAEETTLAVSNNTGAWTSGIKAFSVAIGGSPSSITDLTVDHGATSVWTYACAAFDVDNLSGDWMVGEIVDSAMADDGAESLTLTATPATGDFAIGCLLIEANGGDAFAATSSDLTEQYDYMEIEGGNMWVGYRTGSTSTALTWTDVAVPTTGSAPAFRVQGIGFILQTGPTATVRMTWPGTRRRV
jgi:hypothetical protein